MSHFKKQTKTTDPVLVIGSINTDLVVQVKSLPSPGETVLGAGLTRYAGGKGANQAVAAARLGASVTMVGSLGTDGFGDTALASLEDENIDCRHIARTPQHASGVAFINVAESGENQITVAPGANLTLQTDLVEEAINSAEKSTLLLLQLEVPLAIVEHSVFLAKKKGIRVILDPAPAQTLTSDTLADLFLLTPNQTEAEVLTGIKIETERDAYDAAKCLCKLGVKNVIITLGGKGAVIASSGRLDLISPPTVVPIDTTAAGDCFNGALAFALANSMALDTAVDFACQVASIAVTRPGAQSSMPTLKELQDLSVTGFAGELSR